jgi:hypothetical protein
MWILGFAASEAFTRTVVSHDQAPAVGLCDTGVTRCPRISVRGACRVGPGFPLQVHAFDGNTAETKTILPVFWDRHIELDALTLRYHRTPNRSGRGPKLDRGGPLCH